MLTILLAVGAALFVSNCDNSPNKSSYKPKSQEPARFYVLGSRPITEAEEVDFPLRKKLMSAAEKAGHHKTVVEAVTAFESLLREHPNSVRAQFGLARCVDRLSDIQKSNQLLERSIEEYYKVGMSEGDHVLPGLRVAALERLAERASFRGYKHKAKEAYNKLSEIQPEVAGWRNLLGIQYLMSGQNSQVTIPHRNNIVTTQVLYILKLG